METKPLTWIEVSRSALVHNVQACKSLLKPETKLCAVVKSNAYGHGLVESSKIFLESGADWLAVHGLFEAEILRKAGITAPIYIIGYVELSMLEYMIELDCRTIVYNRETIDELGRIGKPVNVHIKVETGTHRQGVLLDELADFAQLIQTYPNITIEGVSTHFANIEDTTNRGYYDEQMSEFKRAIEILSGLGINPPIKHCAAASAAMLFPESQFDMVRIGVSLYGFWPSDKVRDAYRLIHDQPVQLLQALTWKARIAQIKEIPAGKFVGYGCTFQTERPTKMAVIPIGYYDGYARALSGKAHALVNGQQAKLLGRVSMNNIVIDVTEIPNVSIENEIVLLGKQRDDEISAELFASWADTINYEIPTRIPANVNTNIPRIIIE